MPRNSYPAAAMVRSVPFARASGVGRGVSTDAAQPPRCDRSGRFARFFSRPGRFFLSPSPYYHAHERYVCVCVYIHARLKITIDRAGRDHAAFLPRGTGRGRLRRFFRLCGTQYCLHTHHRARAGHPDRAGRFFTRLDSARGVPLAHDGGGASKKRTDRDGRHIATRSRSRIHRANGDRGTTNRARVGSIDRRRIE